MLIVCPSCLTKNRVAEDRLSQHPLCGHCKEELLAPEPIALPGPIAIDSSAGSPASARSISAVTSGSCGGAGTSRGWSGASSPRA